MKTLIPRAFIGAALCAVLFSFTPAAHAQNGFIREVYTNIFGGGVDGLVNHPSYPNFPAQVDFLSEFESPSNVDNNYGQRVRTYLVPPLDGAYVFWIASDDQSQLFLSTDENPANRQMIAWVDFWTGEREWEAFPTQRSQPVTLTAGKLYYIEALMVEGGGADNLAVRWQLPDGTIEEPIPGSHAIAELIPPQIVRNPVSARVTEGQQASFDIQLVNRAPVSFQWRRNGAVLPGETNATLVLPAVRIADSGARYSVSIANQFGQAVSTEAALIVDRDVVLPAIVSALNPGENNLVAITFSKPVDPVTATTPSNYQISGGVIVQSVSLDPSGRTVILRTSPQQLGTTYGVVINNVRDRAEQPNVIDEDSRVEFTYDIQTLPASRLYGKPEKPGPSSRRTGLVISEIMYAPVPRGDGANIEFIEIYNSNPYNETITGYSLDGAVQYTFPGGVFVPAHGYLVVAADPADVQMVYGLPRVYGPFAGILPDNSGTLLLRNAQGAILLEVTYDNERGWPVGADSTGHSLVLARPSYGEADPRGWSASSLYGGSPGREEIAISNPYEGVVINEYLANTDAPALDFVELYNYSGRTVDLSGAWLSDDASTNRFRIPNSTVLAPMGHVSFDQNTLGFALSSAGERIFLRSPQNTFIIDALRFGAQSLGISSGRSPDGSPDIRVLSAPTPGAANREPQRPAVVINEIMYNPVSDDQDLEYVELLNRSGAAVDLGGWRLGDGIGFFFPQGVTLAPNGYAVVAKNIAKLRTNHAQLTAANSFGDFSGNLSNGGERITLSRPELTRTTNSNGQVTTSTEYVLVNAVTYGTGGRWGQWSDGGGSSLELINAEADNAFASNWADSDESAKGEWTTIERRGIMDNGMTNFSAVNPVRQLHLFLMDAGEALLDNVQVFRDGGTNLVANSGFEQGMKDWIAGGTHDASTLDLSQGSINPNSLHIRAVERGDTAANRVRVNLSTPLTNGTIVTLRADMKWIAGTPEALLRLNGNYLEAGGAMKLPSNLGTPGARNSRAVANAAPAIVDVSHSPVLPVPGQAITVSAHVSDPDRLSLVSLRYRIDPGTNFLTAGMSYNGAGYYSAVIPSQPGNTKIAFYVEALDAQGAIGRFPADAPAREAMIYVGDVRPNTKFGIYRLWVSDRNLQRWARRERPSNKPLDATFVYNDERIVYNMGTMYSGSPFHWSGYNGPLGSVPANYIMEFPDDDLFLGQQDFVLNLPSNTGSDGTGIREQTFFWMADQVNQPANYRRYQYLYINSADRNFGLIFEDAQQPNRDFVEQWHPDDPDGELYKIEDWFEYNESFGFGNLDAELIGVYTTNLVTGRRELKQERYRWWWRKRAVQDSEHDYSELLRLVSAVNNPDDAQFVSEVERLIDIDQWMGVIALRHASGDWDAYGYSRGKNMYAYKPLNGKWRLLHWDVAFAFGLGHGTTHDLFDVTHFDGTEDLITKRMMETPRFRRAYMRALYDAANGPFVASRVNPVIDARSRGLMDNGVNVTSAEEVKQWIASRRQYMVAQLAGVSSGFGINSNNGNNYSTNRNTVILTGTAAVQVKTITINDVIYPVTWKDLTTWEARVALLPNANTLLVKGYDSFGDPVPQATDSITITYSGSPHRLEDRVVFSEIQYNPSYPGAEFVELYNSSSTTSFDLSGYRVNGLGFTFPEGTVIAPGGFLLLVSDPVAFGEAYGFTISVDGVFTGAVDNSGETLSLLAPDDTEITSVRYENRLPWNTGANGFGASLQLIDATVDATRVANWTARGTEATPGATNSVRATLPVFPELWVNEVMAENVNGPADAAGDRDPWVELYNSGSTAINLAGMYLTDDLSALTRWPFPAGSSIAPSQRMIVWLDGEAAESSANALHASFRIDPSSGTVALTGPHGGRTVVLDYLSYDLLPAGRSYGAFPDGQAVRRDVFFVNTPGAENSLATGPVMVFINEWMASNRSTIVDPDDNDYDDWFELYNAGSAPADLSGFTLTDLPEDPAQYTLPAGTVIPAGGFLLIWADSENSDNGDLHANFRLSADGESISLFAPDGALIDEVTFGPQDDDISEGRVPDGGEQSAFFGIPTPGGPNGGGTGGPNFTGVQAAGGTLSLSWTATAGTTYRIEYKNSLNDPAWTLLRDVTATGSSGAASDPIGSAQRFYRILEMP